MDPVKPHNIRFTFSKDERLCSRKIIAEVFQPSLSVSRFPFRINLLFAELPVQNFPAQAVMMVSKKKFRNAVDRNRVKRLMREMYRIHKHRIYEALIAKSKTAALAVIYTGTTSPDYKTAVVVFEKTIDKLIHEINHQ